MCTLTLALSSQCINLISPIYWNCLFVLLTGTISPGWGATGKLEVWLLILSCSSLFIGKLRWFRRCESQIRNKKSQFSPPFTPYVCVFFPSCIQIEHTYFSLKHDTRVYCLKKVVGCKFLLPKGPLGFLCRLLWISYTCTSPRPSTTPSSKWFWDTWSCALAMLILSSRRCSTRISAR